MIIGTYRQTTNHKMINFLIKFIFFLRKPKVIIVVGKGRTFTTEAIYQVLQSHFKVEKLVEKTPNILSIFKREVFLIETDFKKPSLPRKLNHWMKSSQLPILVVTHVGEIPSDYESFSGDRQEAIKIKELAKIVPAYGFLILNSDDKIVQEIDNVTNLKSLTFGFQQEANFQVSDIHTNSGTNFKINYKGNIIPVWLEGLFGKEQIYGALAASSVGIILGLNFVEISEALKKYSK